MIDGARFDGRRKVVHSFLYDIVIHSGQRHEVQVIELSNQPNHPLPDPYQPIDCQFLSRQLNRSNDH
jgi:hypothetical protein